MITAILEAGILTGKLRLPQRLNEIDILLPVVLMPIMTEENKLTTTPRARFIWIGQISRYKHSYRLKEIL
jgi:hypothetical protein